MPYLPLDLDAKRKLEAIERGLGLPRHTMVGGAMDMWETVWRQKSAEVDNITLWAAFGPDDRIVPALVSRGFLDPIVEGKFRVCGAPEWLFGMKGKSRGGHAAKGNLIPGARHKKKAARTKEVGVSAEKPDRPETVLSASAESQPRPLLGSFSALSPNNPTTQQASKDLAGADAPPDETSTYKALCAALFASFKRLRGKDPEPSPRDWKSLQQLRIRTRLGPEEIVSRWERGLQAQFKQRVDTFTDLNEKWDSLASGDPPKRAGNARFVNAQDSDPNAFAKTGTLNDF